MIDVSKVDSYTLNILKERGWYSIREYDISLWKELLSQESYICFDLADRLLKSLGGITVNVSGDRTHMSATFDFNPLKAASGEFDRLQDFENAANEKLCSIIGFKKACLRKGDCMMITESELKEAKRQIDSTLHKLKETVKTFEGKDDPERYRSQITLAKRRIEAFNIAVSLIEREIAEGNHSEVDTIKTCD